MSGRMMTITLPEGLYERVQATARASACSVEEMCAQLIALSLPELEDELPPSLREEFARVSLLSDSELAAVAHSMMDDERQAELDMLNRTTKHSYTSSLVVKSPLAPLCKRGELKLPPFAKGAVRSTGGFASRAVPMLRGVI